MRTLRLLLICVVTVFLSGCAGYKLGPTGGQTAGAKTIQIVPFTNKTLEPRIGDPVTEALRKQVQRDGTFQLATHEAGDIIVTGVITSYKRTEETLSPSDAATATDYRLSMTAQVTARDRATDKVIFDQPVTGNTLIVVGNDLQSTERQALPLLAANLARNITALLVDRKLVSDDDELSLSFFALAEIGAARNMILMKRNPLSYLIAAMVSVLILSGCSGLKSSSDSKNASATLLLPSKICPLKLDGLFYETEDGRTRIPDSAIAMAQSGTGESQSRMADGRVIKISVTPDGNNFTVRFGAAPDADIIKWGLAVDATQNEYFTGIMERVVDGPQQESWADGITEAMNLRGQKVDMILKPTTSVYAPFYLSSRGYAAFAKTDWPGFYDFCSTDPHRVKIEFEGPSFEIKFFTASEPAELVKAHALEAGPPFMPPKWAFTPWRWRDEHKQRANYYDGTPVTGPFNSETMEDILMMKAFGIPCGVYWIDRPWGPGGNGCDDFEIDEQRLPNFEKTIKWLNDQDIEMVMWIAPFFQGQMETNALSNGYTLPGQKRTRNNYPLVDFTNPEAKKYWQDGVAKFLKLGVAGFKLDRAEEQIPEKGDYKVFDGRSIRENRNAYPPMYVKATYEIAKQFRDDFVCMPRAAYTGSSAYGTFWGGDVGGTAEGLRASIIAIQRSAVMGYPNWGADTCGYNKQSLDQEVYARWLAFSCFNPIMEVGPTKNVGFWNLPRDPSYDSTLIAAWRFYARLHQRLADYGYEQAKLAHKTGMPIVRPLFLVDPKAPQAWDNWWTFQYGPDLLVSPVWEKEKRSQKVYLPSGEQWRDAWNPAEVHNGGQTITVNAQLHEIPIFIRVGSNIDLGDLNKEWAESVAIAEKKPNLAVLETEVNAWFEKHK